MSELQPREPMRAAAPAAPPSGSGYALAAGLLGWTLDAFDFFILVFAVPAIAAEFHRSVADIAFTITATLAMRPVGAVVFGWLADRYGRRLPLMGDIVFYSVCEVASGLAPNYGSFLVLRALYGAGMGGEWGVGAALAMESVPAGLRGMLSGVLQEGYAVGYLFAAAAYFLVFPHFGWRPLFFIGTIPAVLALYVCAKVPEPQAWEHSRPGHRAIWRTVRKNFRLFAYLVLLMTMMNLMSHGTQDLYPTFLESQRALGPRTVATVALIYNFGALIGGVFFGYISDRVGRRRAMAAASLLGLCMVPAWLYPQSLAWLTAGAFAMQFMVQGAWGIIPAHLAELSPPAARGLFSGLAYQLGVLLAANAAYVEALMARRLGYANALAVVASIVLLAAVIVIMMGSERVGVDFHSDSDAPADR